MTTDEQAYLQHKIENEGFDYTFINYSDFLDIKDDEFHKLRENYIETRNKLAEYLEVEE